MAAAAASSEPVADGDRGARVRAGKDKDTMESLQAVFRDYLNTPVKIRMYGPGVDKNVLLSHKAMLLKLKGISPNMSFVPLSMKSALKTIALENKVAWKFSDADCEDFGTSVGTRIRTMCRHVSQALLKTSPPAWSRAFSDASSASGAASSSSSSAAGFEDIRKYTKKGLPKDTEDDKGTKAAMKAAGKAKTNKKGMIIRFRTRRYFDGLEEAAADNGKEDTEKGQDITKKGQESTTKGQESTTKGQEIKNKCKEATEKGQEITKKGQEIEKECKEVTKATEEAKDDMTSKFFVGWDAERQAAWRLQHGQPASMKDFTTSFLEDDSGTAMSEIIGVWPDGWSSPIAGISKSYLKGVKSSKTAVARGNLKWMSDDSKLSVRIKQDRSELVWLKEEGKAGGQICQVKTKICESQDAAVKLMIKIAMEYMNGDIKKDALFARRDELLAATHGGKQEVGPRKRPAAAIDDSKAAAVEEEKTEPPSPESPSDRPPPSAPSTPQSKRCTGANSSRSLEPGFTFSADEMFHFDECGVTTECGMDLN
jgi:hypothetical protein